MIRERIYLIHVIFHCPKQPVGMEAQGQGDHRNHHAAVKANFSNKYSGVLFGPSFLSALHKGPDLRKRNGGHMGSLFRRHPKINDSIRG